MSARYSDEFKLEVVDAYRDDPRPAAVGSRFGVHYMTVKRWANEHGCGIESVPSVKKADSGNGGAGENAGAGWSSGQLLSAAEKPKPSGEPESDESAVPGLDKEIDELIRHAERKYMKLLLTREIVEGTPSKDAATVFKTLAEVELKRMAYRLSGDISGGGSDGDESEPGFGTGLLAWERVLRRLLEEPSAREAEGGS